MFTFAKTIVGKGKTDVICKVADLYVELPSSSDSLKRCADYVVEYQNTPDIVITKDVYQRNRWNTDDEKLFEYMESGWLFYRKLLEFDGIMLHSSAVVLDGKAYLFSGPSGMGKSTHARLWQSLFPGAEVINDDKPALRNIDGVWYAYGTPWCGKDGININKKAPVAGICFLRQGSDNTIRRLSSIEAAAAILTQTQKTFSNPNTVGLMADKIDSLVSNIPVFELINRPEPEAAYMSYEALVGTKREV